MGDGNSSSGDLKSIGFGLAISFVAPGVVALWGVGQLLPTVNKWFGATSKEPATGAGFLFVVLASLAVGIFIAGLRQVVLTNLLKLTHIKRADSVDEGKTVEPERRAALNQAVEDFFIYHQFYGNMAIAVVLAYVAYLRAHHLALFTDKTTLVLVGLAVLSLVVSARYSLKRYYEVEGKVLS